MVVLDPSSPKTLLAVLVAGSDKTHEETVDEFNRLAQKMGESATLSLRQFERWLAGALTTLPRPTARRVAQAYWGQPIHELLGPPPEAAEIALVQQPLAAMVDSAQEEDDMERRALLRSVLAGAGLGLSASALATVEHVRQAMDGVLDSSNVSPATLERWERTAYEYAHAYQTVPPQQLLTDVVADFAEVQHLLSQRQPIRFRARLCHVGGQLAALAGIFFSAMGHQREARAWFHTAKLAADEAGESQLAGLAVVRSSIVSFYYGTPTTALEQAAQARSILGRELSPWKIRGLVMEARALARLQQANEACDRLRDAETAFDRLKQGDIADTAFGYTERQFWFTVGNAYTHLGMTAEAQEVQARALALYQPAEYLDPALIQLDRAACMVKLGEPDEACVHAITTVGNAPKEHRAGLITHYGTNFLRQLPVAAQASPRGRELRELLSA